MFKNNNSRTKKSNTLLIFLKELCGALQNRNIQWSCKAELTIASFLFWSWKLFISTKEMHGQEKSLLLFKHFPYQRWWWWWYSVSQFGSYWFFFTWMDSGRTQMLKCVILCKYLCTFNLFPCFYMCMRVREAFDSKSFKMEQLFWMLPDKIRFVLWCVGVCFVWCYVLVFCWVF